MDSTSSRIDRLDDNEKSVIFVKFKQGGVSDGLLRKIAELPSGQSERVIKSAYAALVQALEKIGDES